MPDCVSGSAAGLWHALGLQGGYPCGVKHVSRLGWAVCLLLANGCASRINFGFLDYDASSLTASTEVLACDEIASSTLELSLMYGPGNPATNLQVKFASADDGIAIDPPVGVTNAKGEMAVRITTSSPGAKTVSVYYVQQGVAYLLPEPLRVGLTSVLPTPGLNLLAAPQALSAGGRSTVTVTALAGGKADVWYGGLITVTSSDLQAVLPMPHQFTGADQGSYSFAVQPHTAGSVTVAATDANGATGHVTLQVSAAAMTSLRINGLGSTAVAGTTTVQVQAIDTYGNTVADYSGSVTVTNSQGAPVTVVFTPSDGGVKSVPISLPSSGPATVTATDPSSGATVILSTTVVPGSVASLEWSVPSALTAGSSFTATATARDSFNNLVPDYQGTLQVTSSDVTAVLPANHTLTVGELGSHAFNNLVFGSAGTQTLTVTDVNQPDLTRTASVAVGVNPATHLRVTGIGNAAAGAANSVTVTVLDNTNSIVSSYTDTVAFSSSDAHAVLPGAYTFQPNDHGVATLSLALHTVSSSTSVSVQDQGNPLIAGQQSNIVVTPGAAAVLQWTGIPASSAAGAAHSAGLTAYDAYGNVAAGYTGTVALSSSDGSAGLTPGGHTFVAGDAGAFTFSVTLNTAGSQSVTATDSVHGLTGTVAGISVTAGAATSLTWSGLPSTVTAGAGQSLTVTARDSHGNPAAGYTGTVTLSSTDGSASFAPSTHTFSASDAGVFVFGVILKTAGTWAVSALDTPNSLAVTQTGITVNPGSATRLVLSYPSSVNAGSALTLTVTAQDTWGNTATGYLGTVAITSSDPLAVLPASHAYTAGDGGTLGFSVTLKKAPTETLTATDSANSLAKTSAAITVDPGGAVTLAWAPQPANAPICTAFASTVAVDALDSFGNVATGSSATVSLSISANPGHAKLAGTSSTAASAGVASFTGLNLTAVGTGYTLTAAASGFTSIVSGAFTITNVAPSVVSVGPVGHASGCINIPYVVRDVCGAPAEVTITYDPNASGTFNRARSGSGSTSQGLHGVPTSAAGTALNYSWNSLANVPGFSSSNAAIKVSVVVRGQTASNTSSPFTLNNGVNFGAATALARGTQESCAVPGDFNNDGILDLAVCNKVANTVTLLNGASSYSAFAGGTLSGLASPVAIAVGDIDRDGKLDLAVANGGSSSLKIFFGDGAGGSGSNTSVTVGAAPAALVLLDLNRDGFLDLASGSSAAQLAINLGAGSSFAATVNTPSLALAGLAAIDLDKDGVADLVGVSAASNGYSLFKQWSAGSFASVSNSASSLSAAPSSVAVGDLNNDGNDDVVAASRTGTALYIALGNGAGLGAFATHTGLSASQSIALADVDMDGLLDVVQASSAASNNVGVLHGTGSGSVGATTLLFSGGSTARSIAVADLNRDTLPDLVVANDAGNSIGILTNVKGLSCGTDWNGGAIYTTKFGPAGSAIADINRDGNLDLVVSAPDNDSLEILAGDGAGHLAAPTSFALSAATSPEGIAAGDLNGDGVADVVTANKLAGNVSVCLGNGSGSFSGHTEYSVGANPNAVALADLNGDTYLDVIAANTGSNTLSVLLGSATGVLSAAVSYTVGAGPDSLVVGDFTGDGKLDVVTSCFGSSTFWLLPGTGAGTLGAGTSVGTNSGPSSLGAGDVNSDGTLDVVVANETASNIQIFSNSGSGSFSLASTVAINYNPQFLTVADLTNDGKVDILTIENGPTPGRVLVGDGTGNFGTWIDMPNCVGTESEAYGDLNNDGQPDVVITGHYSSNVTVTLSDGAGGFRLRTPSNGMYPVAAPVTDLAITDLNRDGELDVAFRVETGVSFYLGNGTGAMGSATQPLTGMSDAGLLRSLSAGDITRDGWPDVMSLFADGAHVLRSDGAGNLSSGTTYALCSDPRYAALADMNRDGILDIVAACFGGAQLGVALGNSSGGFGAVTPYALAGSGLGVAVGDIDHNGTLDVLVTVQGSSNTVAIYTNNGAGVLSAAGSLAVGGVPVDVGLGDFNRDGNLDAVVNSVAGSFYVFLGSGSGSFAAGSTYAADNGLNSRLVVADLNHDGYLDVTSGLNTYVDEVYIIFGDGTGALVKGHGYHTESTGRLDGADLNHDGYDDLVCSAHAQGAFEVFTNQ